MNGYPIQVTCPDCGLPVGSNRRGQLKPHWERAVEAGKSDAACTLREMRAWAEQLVTARTADERRIEKVRWFAEHRRAEAAKWAARDPDSRLPKHLR